MMRRSGIWLGMGALIALGSTTAHAAHLVEVDRQQQHAKSPEAASLDPCFASASAFVTAGSNGRTAAIDQALRTSVRGTVPACSAAATVDFSDTVIFMIEADPGEMAGDPVTLCAQARGTVAAGSDGSGTARSQLGAVTIANPAFVSVNAANAVTLGPFDLTQGVDRGQSKANIAAAIGDTVRLELHGIVNATLNGVGNAHADSVAKLSASIGACQTAPAPAASPAGLVALLAALGIGGAWALRRRRQR